MVDYHTDSTAQPIGLSEPVFANDQLQFSAFGLDWGFRSYALPAHLLVSQLGATDSSKKQLSQAFRLNRQRIMRAISSSGLQDARRRVVITTV